MSDEPLLEVEDLRVQFRTGDGVVHAVDGISYVVRPGMTLGIVGESGSGKTVSSLTTMGLTRSRNTDIAGRITFEGESLLDAYDSLEAAHGVHLTAQVTVDTAAPVDVTARLRAAAPAKFGDEAVIATTDLTGGTRDLPSADVLSYRLAEIGRAHV